MRQIQAKDMEALMESEAGYEIVSDPLSQTDQSVNQDLIRLMGRRIALLYSICGGLLSLASLRALREEWASFSVALPLAQQYALEQQLIGQDEMDVLSRLDLLIRRKEGDETLRSPPLSSRCIIA